jgi:ABC-2 type transport system ATP-binding protein
MSDAVIETHDLTRYFGSTCALRGGSLSVPRGSVLALLGRNGSGKTTAIRMLLGLLEPTRGSASVLGHDSRRLPPAVRGRIGYLHESHPAYGWMTAAEAARFQRGCHERWSQQVFDDVLDYFGIPQKQRTRGLSRGQRAGLCLALTLAIQPELLVLDDPALGLDPVARQALLEAMVSFTRRDGRTILFSSHALADVERVADRIAVLDRGVLRAHCPVELFRERVRQVAVHGLGSAAVTPHVPGVLSSVRRDGHLLLTIANYSAATEGLLGGAGASRVEPVEIGLEDAFTGFLGDRRERRSFLSSIGGET